MINLSKNEILKWAKKYDREETQLYSKKLEKNLGKKVRSFKELTKVELVKIVEWKFQGRLQGRGKRILKYVYKANDGKIRKISKEAFRSANEENLMKKLDKLPGVGASLVSVIITFYDPKNYGIFDFRVWEELFPKRKSELRYTLKCYRQVLNELRKIANKNDLNVRVVEKALFKKNKDLPKKCLGKRCP